MSMIIIYILQRICKYWQHELVNVLKVMMPPNEYFSISMSLSSQPLKSCIVKHPSHKDPLWGAPFQVSGIAGKNKTSKKYKVVVKQMHSMVWLGHF